MTSFPCECASAFISFRARSRFGKSGGAPSIRRSERARTALADCSPQGAWLPAHGMILRDDLRRWNTFELHPNSQVIVQLVVQPSQDHKKLLLRGSCSPVPGDLNPQKSELKTSSQH